MNRPALAAAGAMLLASCAHRELAPDRCERALHAAEAVDRLLAILVREGVEPARAAKLRAGLRLTVAGTAAACAVAREPQ